MDYFDNISYTQSHLFLMLFLYLFITHRYSKAVTRGICFGAFLILTLTDCLKLNFFPESSLCYIVMTAIQIFVTQFTGIFISGKRNWKVLFMGLSASNYVIMGSIAATILYIYTKDQWISLLGSCIIHVAVLYVLYKGVRDIWLRQYEKEYTESWWELCLVPVFFYCSFFAISIYPRTLDQVPENIPGILCFMATMCVSYVVVLRYVESDSKRKDIYWKNVIFESYIKGLENQFYLLQQSENSLKILRHDLRHYSSMLSLLLEQGEYEEVKKVIAHVNHMAEEHRVRKYCKNLIVNTIISKMMERAEQYQIQVNLDLGITKEIPVNDYEFTAVIANLFENAIICVRDYQKEKRYIDIKIHCNEERLLVQMQNEYEGEVALDPVNGLPKSRKGENHGLGMQSFQAFSEKIGGDFTCVCKDGVFLLMLFAKF